MFKKCGKCVFPWFSCSALQTSSLFRRQHVIAPLIIVCCPRVLALVQAVYARFYLLMLWSSYKRKPKCWCAHNFPVCCRTIEVVTWYFHSNCFPKILRFYVFTQYCSLFHNRTPNTYCLLKLCFNPVLNSLSFILSQWHTWHNSSSSKISCLG